jgi:hypothetical protein
MTATEALGGEPTGESAAPTPSSSPDWLVGAEPEIAEWITKKGGIASPMDVARGYYNLEKSWGADKAGRTVALPTDPNDQDGWEKVWARLGRPENPKGYGLQAPEGVSQEFVDHLSGVLHKAGLTPGQAKIVTDGWAERQQQMLGSVEKDQVEQQQRQQSDLAELERSWGAEKPVKIDLGRRAARALGWDTETMSQVEAALGTKTFLSSMVKIGEALREDTGVGETSGAMPGLPSTPEGAKAAITARMEDKEFRQRLFNDSDPANASAKREWQELHKRAYPE